MSRIILPTLPDPSGVLVAGEQTVFSTMPVSLENPVVQGGRENLNIGKMGFPVPRAMIGQSDLYAVPKQIGPMRVAGGEIVMLDIGKGKTKVYVDATQEWLMSTVPQDGVGCIRMTDVILMDLPSAASQPFLPVDDYLDDVPPLQNPRIEIGRSGLAKRLTAPNLPASYGPNIRQPIGSNVRYSISGQTLDSTGATLGNCRVVALRTDRIAVTLGNYDSPVVAETTSDAGGNYSIIVPTFANYELIAYKSGSPDVAGITRNDIAVTAA